MVPIAEEERQSHARWKLGRGAEPAIVRIELRTVVLKGVLHQLLGEFVFVCIDGTTHPREVCCNLVCLL